MVGHKHLPNENQVFWSWTKCLSIGIWEMSSIGYPKSFNTGLTHQSSIGHLALFDQALIGKLRLGVWNPSIKLWCASLRLSAGPLWPSQFHNSLTKYFRGSFDWNFILYLNQNIRSEMTFEWHFGSEFPLTRISERNNLRMEFQCMVAFNLRCSGEGSSGHFESEFRLITRPRAERSCLIGNVLNRFELDFEAGKEGRFEGMK